MPLTFPELPPPLHTLSLCMQVPIAGGSDLDRWFEQSTTLRREIVRIDGPSDEDPRWTRLLVNRLDGKTGHFHIDIARQSSFRSPPEQTSTLDSIHEKFSHVAGVSVGGYYEAEFSVPFGKLTKRSALVLLSGVEMNIGGIGASLSGGNLRLNDELCYEIKWTVKGDNDAREFEIELVGFYGDRAITDDIAVWIESRAITGFDRFVSEKQGTASRKVSHDPGK